MNRVLAILRAATLARALLSAAVADDSAPPPEDERPVAVATAEGDGGIAPLRVCFDASRRPPLERACAPGGNGRSTWTHCW